MASVASLRIGKFAKYLSEFGWEPIILTVNEIDENNNDYLSNTGSFKIYRTRPFNFYRYIASRLIKKKIHTSADKPVTNRKNHFTWKCYLISFVRLFKPLYTLPLIRMFTTEPILWYITGARKGLQIINEENIDLIFSSYNPSVSHMIAARLQKRSKLPWIADFRDLWSQNHYAAKTQPFHFLEKQVEKIVMKRAAKLITVSTPLANELVALHAKPVDVITNGYDESDYISEIPLVKNFMITYTGSIYPKKQDPTPLFEAISELALERKLPLKGFKVRFYGSNLDHLLPTIRKYGIERFIEINDQISFYESTSKQQESTILLLLSWNDPKYKGVYTAKVFEYLGAKRPILAIGICGSVVDDLLNKTGSGIISNKTQDLKSILVRWFEEFENTGKISSYWHPNKCAVKQYTRQAQTEILASIFNELLLIRNI